MRQPARGFTRIEQIAAIALAGAACLLVPDGNGAEVAFVGLAAGR